MTSVTVENMRMSGRDSIRGTYVVQGVLHCGSTSTNVMAVATSRREALEAFFEKILQGVKIYD